MQCYMQVVLLCCFILVLDVFLAVIDVHSVCVIHSDKMDV